MAHAAPTSVVLAAILVFVAPWAARAQSEPEPTPEPRPNLLLEPVPEPPAEELPAASDVFVVSDPNVSDDDVIRGAAQELAETQSTAPTRAPLPPAPYRAASLGDASAIVDPEPAVRLFAEIGAGALGVVVGGAVGGLLLWGVLEAEAIPQVELGAMAGAVVLGSLGVSSGIALAGEATGGRGNFGHAFMGQLVGAAVALPVVVWGLSDEGELGLGVAAAAVFPLIGGVIGYELAHADTAPRPRAAIAPIRDGVLASVSGPLD